MPMGIRAPVLISGICTGRAAHADFGVRGRFSRQTGAENRLRRLSGLSRASGACA